MINYAWLPRRRKPLPATSSSACLAACAGQEGRRAGEGGGGPFLAPPRDGRSLAQGTQRLGSHMPPWPEGLCLEVQTAMAPRYPCRLACGLRPFKPVEPWAVGSLPFPVRGSGLQSPSPHNSSWPLARVWYLASLPPLGPGGPSFLAEGGLPQFGLALGRALPTEAPLCTPHKSH